MFGGKPSLTALAAAMLAVTGWLGGELAFRAGIGVCGRLKGTGAKAG